MSVSMSNVWNLSCHSLGFLQITCLTTLNVSCDDPRWPFWATRLLCLSLRALKRDLFGQRKNRWCELNYHPVVLPFSFPFFVFLVMLYLHFLPHHSKEMPFLLSHTQPQHFLSQGSCSNGNTVGFLTLPTAVLILALVFKNSVINGDFSALRSPHLCKRKSCLFQEFLGDEGRLYMCSWVHKVINKYELNVFFFAVSYFHSKIL